MKIDFNASVRELFRHIDSPYKSTQESTGKPQEFASLLSSIDPENKSKRSLQSQAGNADKVSQAVSSDVFLPNLQSPAPMGRYNFVAPEFKIPAIDSNRIGQPIASSPQNPIPAPKIVTAERIAPANANHISLAEQPNKSNELSLTKLIREAGLKHGIDPALGLAVAETESGFDPSALSTDGHSSKGLFQLLDSTGRQLHTKAKIAQDYDPFDPEQNADLGLSYLRQLHDLFSRPVQLTNGLSTNPAATSSSLEKLALAAFNAGEGRVAAAQKSALGRGQNPAEYSQIEAYLPETTKEYVSKVMAAKARIAPQLLG